MRLCLALLLVASAVAACGKSSTAPHASQSLAGIAGSWTGHVQNGQNTPIVMTLADSSGSVTGIARFGGSYVVTGQLIGSSVSLSATNSATEAWLFSGTMATGTMAGNISYAAVSYPINFYKN